MSLNVKRTERGWAGHFCAASSCAFRRNTLLECGDVRIVVSTVGDMRTSRDVSAVQIGFGRYYETMAFHACEEGPYLDAETSRPLSFSSKWSVDNVATGSDNEANDMHESVVAELTQQLGKGEQFKESA